MEEVDVTESVYVVISRQAVTGNAGAPARHGAGANLCHTKNLSPVMFSRFALIAGEGARAPSDKELPHA